MRVWRANCAHMVFPGSSAVEQAAVNRLVGGSIPSRGANSSPVGQFDARTSLSFVKPLACSGLLCFCCRQPMAMTVWQTVVEKFSATRNKRH